MDERTLVLRFSTWALYLNGLQHIWRQTLFRATFTELSACRARQPKLGNVGDMPNIQQIHQCELAANGRAPDTMLVE